MLISMMRLSRLIRESAMCEMLIIKLAQSGVKRGGFAVCLMISFLNVVFVIIKMIWNVPNPKSNMTECRLKV